MRIILGVVFLAVLAGSLAKNCPARRSSSKLVCYFGKLTDIDDCFCTHAVLPANSDVKAIQRAREHLRGVKILVTVHEFNQGLIDLLKNSKVDGLEISLKKLDSKNDISDFISTVRSKLGSDLYLALSVPSKSDVVAKYYDFKSLSKHADLFILQTAFLGASKNVTFHPSRLSGMWDMQNTDSVVDLVTGLGAPLSKLVIAAPVQAFRFTLQDEEYTAPGSPALEIKSITRNELCELMNGGTNWTLERDEDQAGPYIFSKNQWIAFEDQTSMDIKAKYSRVRGLAGMALKDVSEDGGASCGSSVLEAAYNGLSRQARAPRGAVLHSLEREIKEASQPLDRVHVSPYRISRIIDVEGKIHAVRQDTRTEFQCSRQGYFVHPRSCNRFYRCVKFDQLVDDFNVFEFDCPAGLAFDERVEVCVWPGSLPHGTPCSGSSEIAPVPRQRFDCPAEQGYYADPENCRWFFACLDHGKSPLTAYEFRCPFGLVFDSDRLMCEWPWLVPKCASGLGVNLASEYVYGGYSAGQGVGLLLEQYDGLGSLGAVKLGGIAGKIQQPVVYSNVGTAGLGYNNGGYVNQDGYITGNGLGLGGLSYKAAQSLHNAGLLRTDLAGGAAAVAGAGLGLGYQQGGALAGQGNIQYSGQGLASAGAGLDLGYQQGAGISTGQHNIQYSGQGLASAGAGLGLGYQQGAGISAGQHNIQYSGQGLASAGAGLGLGYQQGAGIAIGQHNVQYSGQGLASGADGVGTSGQYQYNSGAAGEGGLEIDAANLNLAGAYGAKTSGANTLSGQYVSGAASAAADLGAGLDYNANAFGAKSSRGQLHYQGGDAGQGLNVVQYQTNLNNAGAAGLNTGSIQDLNTLHVQGNLGSSLGHSTAGANDFGATSSQSFTQYNGQAGQVLQANAGADLDNHGVNIVVGNAAANQDALNSVQYEDNLGIGLGYNAANSFGLKINQGQNAGLVYDAFGGKSSQTFTRYQGGSLGQGVAGNINIVGGGYSAVGQSKSGVEINGESGDTTLHSTASPISVTTFASVPTVTSVPIPALKTASGFESYKGGVVANVPQLQYKIHDSNELANISANFVKFVSTTPSALLVNEGYRYQKPVTFFNQDKYSGRGAGAGAGATSYSYQSLDSSAGQGGFEYSSPSVAQGGVTVSGYTGSSTVRPTVAVVQQNIIPTVSIQKNEGYVYSKPSIAFEEGPARTVSSYSISSTANPVTFVQQQPIVPVQPVVHQPAIATYERQDYLSGGYKYEQPAVVVSPTVQPIVKQRPQIYVSSTVAPIVEQKVQVQPAVSSYSFTQNVGSGGYDYPKPSVAFVERPAVRPAIISKFTIRKPTAQPAVVNTYSVQQPAVVNTYSVQQPAVVNTYNVQQPAVVNTYSAQQPAVVEQNVVQPGSASYSYEQNYKSDGYHYAKPTIAFEERPVVQYQQPAVRYGSVQPTYTYQRPAVSTYSYQDVAQKAVGVYQPQAISTYSYAIPSSTPRPVVVEQPVRPAVVSSYSYTPSTTSAPISAQSVDFGGYDYPRPSVAFAEEPTPVVTSYENRQPVQEVPFVKQKAYVTGQAKSYQYSQQFEAPAAPVVVDNYQAPVKASVAPVVVENYQVPVSTPTYQASVNGYSQAVDTSSSFFYNNINPVSTTPVYKQEYYSTPVSFVQSTPRPNYKSVVSSVVATKVIPTTQAPNFYYYDSRLSSTPKTVVGGYDYPKPNIAFEETPVQPVVTSTYLPPTREYLPAKTGRPISSYSFSSLNTQYQTVSTPRPFTVSTTPLAREYIPVTSKVQVTTPQPVFVVPEVSTPAAYVPVRSRVRYTTSRPVEITAPARKYIPVSVTTPTPVYTPTASYVPSSIGLEVSSIAPLEVSREYLPVRSRVRVTTGAPRPAKVTIIKQNDLHPMLAAKLGAQCTCVSNTLNLRKKQKIIIVEDDDDDDGYVVANEGGKVVENYQYNPQDTIDVTPSPQAYVHSTTSTVLAAPSPTYAVRRRVRVRPVTEAVDVFLKNDVTPVGASDAEIASAVRTGLKLVKQAAKEGAEEALTGYGGASVRDTIDCQRAGLFRHPNQCNKFYACRWDCTKNKFTLHTFNCPVHLTFDNSLGACNWPSQGPACLENTLLPSE